MEDYEILLKRAQEKMPKGSGSGERFEMPHLKVHPAGAKTIIVNMDEVAKILRREPAHLLKFLLKELATKQERKEMQLTLLGRFTADHINKKLEIYVKQFVICPQCNRPDTKISREDRLDFMICEACGAKQAISKV